jgi:DNA-binding NarL/FixJ family response regulator
LFTMPPSVLIVDDHPSYRALARAMLRSEGFEVVGEAEDGRSALKAARELKPGLVLLDVKLPDIDGFEVARQLARNEDPPPVILISSRAAGDYGTRVARSGALGFIVKDELTGSAVLGLLAPT